MSGATLHDEVDEFGSRQGPKAVNGSPGGSACRPEVETVLEQTFEELIAEQVRHLVRVLQGLGIGWEDARDFAQGAVVRALENASKLAGKPKPVVARWMKVVAVRIALDGQKRRAPVEVDLASVAGRSPEPADALEKEERAVAVRGALAALKPRHRMLVVSAYINDVATREIAGTAEGSHRQVRSMLHRARCLLDKDFRRLGLAPECAHRET